MTSAIIPNPGPGYAKHPDHLVEIEAVGATVTARVGGAVVAESEHALVLREQGYEPVFYFPARDVTAAALVATNHTSYCPFKGHATYWSIVAGGTELNNVAWTYAEPYDEAIQIKNHIAFYQDRVEVENKRWRPA